LAKSSMATQNTPARTKITSTACSTTRCTLFPPSFAVRHPANCQKKSYYPLLRAFKSPSGSISDLYNMIETVKYTCADSTLLGNFIENHDNPRFAS
jgi:hypothetical protein